MDLAGHGSAVRRPYGVTRGYLCHHCQMSSICTPLRRSAYADHARPIVIGVIVGGVAWVTIGLIGLLLLRTAWSDYEAAVPTKAYSSVMLVSRLALASVCSIASGFLATKAAKEDWRAASRLGAVLLLGSAPLHLPISPFSAWADYPTWYHAVYLLSLMPLTCLGGYFARSGVGTEQQIVDLRQEVSTVSGIGAHGLRPVETCGPLLLWHTFRALLARVAG